MAKKGISKHSRAARRGEVESGEAKDLDQVPKLESETKKSIIRSSILSENLLAKKLENKRNKNKRVSKNINSRNRVQNLGGILNTKIANSKARYNFVNTSRKSGWDKINEAIKNENVTPSEPEKDKEQQEEDEYVKQFFEQDTESAESNGSNQNFNKFALLEESEA